MYSKKIIDNFSEQIEIVKYKYKHDNLIDALESMLEDPEKWYDFITHSNVSQYLNKSMKEKLQIEFTKRNMMKDDHKKEENNSLF